jgi:hypothetical protein
MERGPRRFVPPPMPMPMPTQPAPNPMAPAIPAAGLSSHVGSGAQGDADSSRDARRDAARLRRCAIVSWIAPLAALLLSALWQVVRVPGDGTFSSVDFVLTFVIGFTNLGLIGGGLTLATIALVKSRGARQKGVLAHAVAGLTVSVVMALAAAFAVVSEVTREADARAAAVANLAERKRLDAARAARMSGDLFYDNAGWYGATRSKEGDVAIEIVEYPADLPPIETLLASMPVPCNLVVLRAENRGSTPWTLMPSGIEVHLKNGASSRCLNDQIYTRPSRDWKVVQQATGTRKIAPGERVTDVVVALPKTFQIADIARFTVLGTHGYIDVVGQVLTPTEKRAMHLMGKVR